MFDYFCSLLGGGDQAMTIFDVGTFVNEILAKNIPTYLTPMRNNEFFSNFLKEMRQSSKEMIKREEFINFFIYSTDKIANLTEEKAG
jgi:hypothetical protein